MSGGQLRIGAEITVAFRSAKARHFRGAKGDYATLIFFGTSEPCEAMIIEFKLPELGEHIESGDVANVLVEEGQHVEGNQGVIELETEKAIVEIPCSHAGKVVKVYVKKGDTVKVGQPIIAVESEVQASAARKAPPAAGTLKAAASPSPRSKAAEKAAPAKAVEVKLPQLGEHITSGDIVKVLVTEGQQVEGNQGLIEIETEKAIVEIPCPFAGKVVKIHVKAGDTVTVGQPILTVKRGNPTCRRPSGSAAEPPVAEEAALNLRRPCGSGLKLLLRRHPSPLEPCNRVTAGRYCPRVPPHAARPGNWVLTSTRSKVPASTGGLRRRMSAQRRPPRRLDWERNRPQASNVCRPASRRATRGVPRRREKLSQIRKAIAAQMSRSASTIPHVTNFDDADITELDQIRKGVPQGFLGANLKLTTTPLVMKAIAMGWGATRCSMQVWTKSASRSFTNSTSISAWPSIRRADSWCPSCGMWTG